MDNIPRRLARDDVVACYQAFFGRAPENESVIENKLSQHATLEHLLLDFITSQEFASPRKPRLSFEDGVASVFHANNGDKIEFEVSDDAMSEILKRVIAQWTILGDEDPHWAVLSGDDFKRENIDANREKFYSTGEGSFNVIEDFCRRNNVIRPKGACLELGCGVGRVTNFLAKNFERVVGFDVSEPILRLARRHLESSGLANCDLRLLRKLNDLSDAGAYDFFYSIIVLQHNPPPVMKRMLEIALTQLRKGGAFLFQIPTHRSDYAFDAKSYLENAKSDEASFDMHVLPMHAVLDTIAESGCRVKEVVADNYAGHPGSHTFFGVKP